MSRRLFTILILSGIMAFSNVKSSNSIPPICDDVQKEIELKGSLNEGSIRSLVQIPVLANISSSTLEVIFLTNIGVVQVEIISQNEGGIYDESVDTNLQNYLSIDISGWQSGIYQLRIINTSGQYLYGTFTIE
jgi:hypothetical protein